MCHKELIKKVNGIRISANCRVLQVSKLPLTCNRLQCIPNVNLLTGKVHSTHANLSAQCEPKGKHCILWWNLLKIWLTWYNVVYQRCSKFSKSWDISQDTELALMKFVSLYHSRTIFTYLPLNLSDRHLKTMPSKHAHQARRDVSRSDFSLNVPQKKKIRSLALLVNFLERFGEKKFENRKFDQKNLDFSIYCVPRPPKIYQSLRLT